MEPCSSDRVATAVVACGGESDDKNNKKENNENSHEEEVDSQETRAVTISADEANERAEEEETAKDHDGPAEKLDALVVRL